MPQNGAQDPFHPPHLTPHHACPGTTPWPPPTMHALERHPWPPPPSTLIPGMRHMPHGHPHTPCPTTHHAPPPKTTHHHQLRTMLTATPTPHTTRLRTTPRPPPHTTHIPGRQTGRLTPTPTHPRPSLQPHTPPHSCLHALALLLPPCPY
ncbi:hypothetical protein BDZ94DRAFT_1313523 [Collybia nuda]|uniref:Uncharacterized protein n=1 Tax=Collybia nuda TaxID=64659 RepID=A0A9P5XWY2_9AGAR|nr:hypothetical protein BDZ94DRAFT_1313523 [Collybia nuda]